MFWDVSFIVTIMDKKITNFIAKEKLISDDVCKSFIEEIEKCEWKKHVWYSHHSKQEHTYEEKELDVCFEYPEYIAESINLYLNKALSDYKLVIKDLMKGSEDHFFNMINYFSRVRFNRYPTGTLMRPHYDHIHSLFDGEHRGIPVISVVGCLNNDFEGGEFVFYDDFKVELNPGEILLFPSNFMYPHRVEEVTSGSRYTFVCWGW